MYQLVLPLHSWPATCDIEDNLNLEQPKPKIVGA